MKMRKYVRVEELGKAEFEAGRGALSLALSLAESMEIRSDQTMSFVITESDCTEHLELFDEELGDPDNPVHDEVSNVVELRNWILRNDCDVLVTIN